MEFIYKEKTYKFQRYPATDNRSLRAWSAADEHILRHLAEHNLLTEHPVISHDRFGFLTVLLHDHKPINVITQKSQEKALFRNLIKNSLTAAYIPLRQPMMPLPKPVELALMKVPKSLDLFRLYLTQLSQHVTESGTVLCGFMTRHFSKQMLEIAGAFFENVEQSKAWKKSRLLILTGPKPYEEKPLIQSVVLNRKPKRPPMEEMWKVDAPAETPEATVTHPEPKTFYQYPGVFSAGKIDMATRFFLDHLQVKAGENRILDLGCGNGVLGFELLTQHPEAELHLLDDSWLAVESAKLNAPGAPPPGEGPKLTIQPKRKAKEDAENTSPTAGIHYHWEDALAHFPADHFDLIVCNPPFHFEYEIDVSVPLRLFREVARCLKPGGRFLLVANLHLNYRTHLTGRFELTRQVARHPKFEIILCEK